MLFSIKSGSNYSNKYLFKLLNLFNIRKKLTFDVTFSNNCRYVLNEVDQGDINKLFGFSYGINHHKNSIRFGWLYDIKTDSILIYSYYYINNIRHSNYLAKLDFCKKYKFTILDDNNWILSIKSKDKQISKIEIHKDIKFQYGIKLWPYFGGNCVAPNDMNISLE